MRRWNPLDVLYGTLTVLVVNTIAHFYTVAHITALTALKQIDAEFEAVSASLKVPFWRTFGRVTVPICMPAILDIAVYMFVNALTTVSAVIFLYGAGTKLASIAIVHMDESGAIAAAAAMATVIMVTALGAKVAHLVLDRLVFERLQAGGSGSEWCGVVAPDSTRPAWTPAHAGFGFDPSGLPGMTARGSWKRHHAASG